jgi:hypothetical protein
MNPTYDFTGQVALVTGASSGMGLATARAFAQAGAAVVLSDINEDTLRTAMDDLTPAATPHADHSNPRHPFSAHRRAPARRSTTPDEGRIIRRYGAVVRRSDTNVVHLGLPQDAVLACGQACTTAAAFSLGHVARSSKPD